MSSPLSQYLAARWRGYAERIGLGLLLAAGLMIGAVWSGRWWLLPVGALCVLWVAWFYAASTWHMRSQLVAQQSAEQIWSELKLDRFARFVCIEVGMREMPLYLSRKLQRGALKIVDVYNPQLMPDPALARLRIVAQKIITGQPADPRAIWVEGRIDQLPQRDESVPAVVIDQVLSTLAQAGDRERLLREAYRVLEPGGQLLVIEPTQRRANRWVLGGWNSAEAVEQLIAQRHFVNVSHVPINGLLALFVASKPTPQVAQLHFNF